MPSLTEFVLANVDTKAYYQKKFPEWDGNHNTNVKCPFPSKHSTGEDKRPSFSININGTGGAFCQACSTRIGSIIHYEKCTAAKGEIDDETAASRIFNECVRPILGAPSEVEKCLHPYQIALKSAPIQFRSLQTEIGISKETAERFNLGWDASARRVTIPIFDDFNQLLNIRFYRLPSMRADEKFPKILNKDGYGSPSSLFPAPALFSLCRTKHRPPVVYWFSGERDTLKAWDDGIPSFCYTTGENVCKKEWGMELANLGATIGIVQDNDKAGKDGAQARLSLMQASGISAFILDLEGDKVKDYSDYRREGGTVVEFLEYGNSKAKEAQKESKAKASTPAPVKKNGFHPPPPPPPEPDPDDDDEHFSIPRIFDPSKSPIAGEYSVSSIGHDTSLFNKRIKVRAIVSGKHDRTYHIPKLVKVGEHIYHIPISREILQLIREKDDSIVKLIQHWIGTKAKVSFLEHVTVTEVEIIPMIQPGVEVLYTNQRCYYFGPMVECNKPYLMTIIPTTEMKTQEALGMIVDIEPVSNILDSYKFDEKSYALLASEFHPDEGETVYDNLRVLAHSVAEHYSGIHNRDDLHLACLLSWISPLQFEFPYEAGLQRGWLNTLVLGDTETGKSKVCQKLASLFHCGVFINAESCSYVGVVGGAVKSSSGMFLLRWGKIPLYNRQLVVMEELSGLTTQEISWMSEVRSAGIARYDKAGLTGETSAKTRLVCLSNVRGSGKSLSDYNTGVQAAQELLGQNEDLARFDITLTVTDDEVDGGIINRDRSEEVKKAYSTEELNAFKELVMFAWSLKPSQIEFSLSAYRECLKWTMKLSSEFHPSIPVFKSGSGRLKLARLALSIACIQFAWDKQKEKLVVEAKHVEAAATFLHKLYCKPSFGYKRFSHVQYSLQKVNNEPEVIKKIQEVFKDKEKEFYNYVAYSNGFTKFDLAEALGATHFMFVERVISTMFLANLIKKVENGQGWMLSKAGRKWVEKQLNKY